MKAECCMESSRQVNKCMENETKCMICGNTVFRVGRITPELVMLTCEKCGEPHMIGANSDQTEIHLTFWSSETADVE
ncbi:MAG: hypothetical protein CW691_02565 [Candidatus Bathyarchaeum sp.]|nr:MAG: hypothetical protein CW691_02565 [Candidatus Bathyarchaeum sp.]